MKKLTFKCFYCITSKSYLALSILFVLTMFAHVRAFEIPAAHKSAAVPVINEIIECRFDNAMRVAETALAADGDNAMAAVMHLVAMGMRDVDADMTVDSVGFMLSFDRAKNIVSAYETAFGVSSYSTMLRGFTLGIHSSFHLKNKTYFAAAGTGLDAIKLMQEAKALDTLNFEVNIFLGLYEYGLSELKKRMAGVVFWLPGNKKNGIRILEEGAQNAALTHTAAKLALIDIYIAEKEPHKAREMIGRMKKELPESRFLLWAEVKYHEDQKAHDKAARAYGELADAYEKYRYGAYNGVVTRNKQAHALAGAGKTGEAIAVCKELLRRGGDDERVAAVMKDTEKLLKRLERTGGKNGRHRP